METPSPQTGATRRTGWPRRLAIGLGISAITLLAFEGLCSTIVFVYHARKNSRAPLAERVHTRYDSEIGWVATPDFELEDMYRPGAGLRTNAQGFRNEVDFASEVPQGAIRIVCSGDSFTLGYGVDDTETWPSQLEQLDERLEVLNLGQGGYGVGQAYLWYVRATQGLDHDVHLFAFIVNDFRRMRRNEFSGYGKPVLAVIDGELEVSNRPVPRLNYVFPWLANNRPLLDKLGTFDLLSLITRKRSRGQSSAVRLSEQEATDVAVGIFTDLDRRARDQGARVVLVLLPSQDQKDPTLLADLRGWREEACMTARASGIPFFDLREEFEPLEPDQLAAMFIPEGHVDFPDAKGHYTAAGNALVANAIWRRLSEIGFH